MQIETQRRLDKYVGSLICFALSLVHRLQRRWFPQAPARPSRRILVILLSEMGSLVLAQPMFQRIRHLYPQAEIHLLQFKKNNELGDLLELAATENLHGIDDRSLFSFAWDTFTILWKLRKKKIDVVIDCELFARIGSILSFLSGASVRVGFHSHTQEGLYRGDFINRPVPYNPYRHIARQFVTLADAVDSTTTPKAKQIASDMDFQIPPISPDAGELKRLEARLASIRGTSPSVCPEVLIYPSGGMLPIRAWPQEYYRELSLRLIEDGYSIGIIGMPADKEQARQILETLPEDRCFDLTGFTRSVKELMLLFHLARLLITNDGGPGHFAALTPIASMVFFGPETPLLYGPVDDKAVVFHTELPCSPCLTAYNHRNSPCDGDNLCLKSISVEQVYRKACELLQSGRHRE